MRAYLVIVKAPLMSYADQYKVFTSKQRALDFANKHGFTENFLPFSDTLGMYNFHAGGDEEVGILPLEIDTLQKEC